MRCLQAARRTSLNRELLTLLVVDVVLLGLGADQAFKGAVLGILMPGWPAEVVGTLLWFNPTFNPGATFSLGTSVTLALSIFAVVALLACVFVMLRRMRTPPQGLAVELSMAGASGNLHDRLLRTPNPLLGHVADFIQLPHFVIFNVTDIYTTNVTVLAVLLNLRNPSSDGKGSERT